MESDHEDMEIVIFRWLLLLVLVAAVAVVTVALAFRSPVPSPGPVAGWVLAAVVAFLPDVCERNGTRLVLLFERLAAEGVRHGTSIAGFMRLGSLADAEFAATHIGKESKLVLSSLTKAVTGSKSHTTGRTETFSKSHSESTALVQPVLTCAGEADRGDPRPRRG
jgi:hypothetical protein